MLIANKQSENDCNSYGVLVNLATDYEPQLPDDLIWRCAEELW
uniref:Uncharacterized protein n=1 Tax=Anguilla anguilla TaxID=7936 RepID=A0A0E9UTV8_ANGAN